MHTLIGRSRYKSLLILFSLYSTLVCSHRQNQIIDVCFFLHKIQIIIPIMEDLAPQAKTPVNHYWLLVVNIRDKRFELIDSMRSKENKILDANAKKIICLFKNLWDLHYPNSQIKLDNFGYEDIEPPKQTTK